MERHMAIEDKTEDRNARLKAFGLELAKRRKDAGYRYAKDFAPIIGISPQYLAQLENASPSESRVARVPGIEIIENISEVLKWPKLEILQLLGVVTDKDLKEIPNYGLGAFIDPSASREIHSLEDFKRVFHWVLPAIVELVYMQYSKERELQESTNNGKS